MDLNSREKLLAGVAALSLLGISPQQTVLSWKKLTGYKST